MRSKTGFRSSVLSNPSRRRYHSSERLKLTVLLPICSSKLGRPGSQDLSAFSPISASTYFSQALEVDPPSRNIAFRAYYTPSTLSGQPDTQTGKQKRGSVLVCHHGGGSSGTTFACLAKAVRELSAGELGVLAFDARDHGKHDSLVLSRWS